MATLKMGSTTVLTDTTLANAVQDNVTRLGTVTAGTLSSGVTFPDGHVIKTTVVTTTGSISSSTSAYAAIENFSYTGTVGNLLFLTAKIQNSVRGGAYTWYNIYYGTADATGTVGNVLWYDDTTNGHLVAGANVNNITGVVTCLSGANSFYLRGGTTSSPVVTLGGGQKYTIMEVQQ